MGALKTGFAGMKHELGTGWFITLMLLMGVGLLIASMVLYGIAWLFVKFPILFVIALAIVGLGAVGFTTIAYFVGRKAEKKRIAQEKEFAEADAREAARQAARKPVKKQLAGFTLIELMIVVVIVGILAAIFVPQGGGPFFLVAGAIGLFGSSFFWSTRMKAFGEAVIDKFRPRWEDVGPEEWRVVKEFPVVQMREVRKEQKQINLKNGKTRWVPAYTEDYHGRRSTIRSKLEAMPKVTS